MDMLLAKASTGSSSSSDSGGGGGGSESCSAAHANAAALAQNFTYLRAQSLAHLLSLLFHPPAAFLAKGTTLLVVDSISGLFPSYFDNPSELKSRFVQGKISSRPQLQWLLGRRWNVTSEMASQLVKLASTHQIAVLLTNHIHTKIQRESHPTLYPALTGGAAWEGSIWTRIVLYRDLARETAGSVSLRVRFAEVMKKAGKLASKGSDECIIAFAIEQVKRYSLLATISSCIEENPERTLATDCLLG